MLPAFILAPRALRALTALLLAAGAVPAFAAPSAACDMATLAQPLTVGQALGGTLSATECHAGNAYLYADRVGMDSLYKFTISRTTTLELAVTNAQFSPHLNMFDGSGTFLYQTAIGRRHRDFERDDGTRIRATFRPGTYYVTVVRRSERDTSGGASFNFELRALDTKVAQDAGGKCDEAAYRRGSKLELDGAAADGELSVTDCVSMGGGFGDTFHFDVPTRRTVEVTVTSPDYEPMATVADAGLLPVPSEGKNPQPANFRVTLPAGRYFMLAHSRKDNFATGAYRATIRTVGTPTNDKSALGATCAAEPDALAIEKDRAEVKALLTPASCKGKDGLPYHRYSFSVARPSFVSLKSSESVNVTLSGPSGVIKPTVVQHDDHTHSNIEQQLMPGKYVLSLAGAPKAVAERPVLRFTETMRLLEAYPGLHGSSCSLASALDLVPGKQAGGEVGLGSCRLSGADKAGATAYSLTLIDPHKLTLELAPGKDDPGLFVALRRHGTDTLEWIKPGTPFRKGDVDLPPGTHTIYVGGTAMGSYTMKTSATPNGKPSGERVASEGAQCGAEDVTDTWRGRPHIGEFNARSCKLQDPNLGVNIHKVSVYSAAKVAIEIVPGSPDPALVAAMQLQGEQQTYELPVEKGKPFRRSVELPAGEHLLLIGGRSAGRYKLVVSDVKAPAAKQ